MAYELETSMVANEILRRSARKVILQLPDGLKNYGLRLVEKLHKRTGATIYLSADPCYGACDHAIHEAEQLGADLIIHYGHTPFPKVRSERILYVEARSKLDVDAAVEKALPLLNSYNRIGLTATVQHIHMLKKVSRKLSGRGKKTLIGKAGGKVKHNGQVLGCDYTTARRIQDHVDIFLHIGGGAFHALGVNLATGKPVVLADPYRCEAEDVTSAAVRLSKRRRAALSKLAQAEKVAVLVGLKIGQFNPRLAEKIKRRLENLGKSVVLICLKEVTPEALDNFLDVEAFVNTACPRVGVDDWERYVKPVVAADEAIARLGS